MDFALSSFGDLFLHLPDGHRTDLSPFAFDERDIGPICADHLLLTGCRGCFGLASLLTLRRLSSLVQRSCPLGPPPHCWFAHLNAQKLFEHLLRTRVRHPDRQMGQMLSLSGRQAAWE